jgi:hypothetical protein
VVSKKYCAKLDCTSDVEAPGRRFCAIHRREHGLKLQGQLANLKKKVN